MIDVDVNFGKIDFIGKNRTSRFLAEIFKEEVRKKIVSLAFIIVTWYEAVLEMAGLANLKRKKEKKNEKKKRFYIS